MLENIRPRRADRLAGVVVEPIHRFFHPERRVVKVFVQIRLTPHFEAVVRRHLGATAKPVTRVHSPNQLS